MFKRISIILLILFTLLAFTVGASATAVTMVKADDDSYIRWMAGAVVILEINSDGTTTLATTPSASSVLMSTVTQVQFYDSGLNIGATGDGVLAINSDGTLVTTATTSVTIYTPTYVLGYDASNKVTTTVGGTGTVKVATTGASTGSYEIETDDAAIVLDAAAGITLDSGTGDIGLIGTIMSSDAAGPSIIDAAATATTPTLIPNKAAATTGFGWVSAGIVNVAIGGTSEFEFSATGIDMNANGLTELGTVAGTAGITLAPTTTGTLLDFVLETEWTGGTLINADFASSTTLGSTVVFLNFDCANVLHTSEQSVTAIDINLPQATWDNVTKTLKGIEITAQGALVLSTGTAAVFTGVDITIPAITQTSGTVTSTGVLVTGGVITSGTAYGIRLAGVFTTGIQIGLSGTAIDFVLHGDRALEIYASTNATGGNVMPVYVSLATDGTCTARAGEFVLTATAQLGDYANPLKSYLDVSDTSGGTGTISGLCIEVLYPEEQQTGSIAMLELEAVVNTSYVYTDYTSVIMLQVGGTDSGSFQDGAYFLFIGGLTSATGDIWYNNTLMCSIIGTDWYLPFSSVQGSYTTAFPVDVTVAAGTAIDIGTSVIGIDFTGTYTTGAIRIGQSGASSIELAAYGDFNIASYTACAATSGVQKHNIFQGIMDGAGALGRVVYVGLTIDDVEAGAYVNAFKAQLDFDTSGSTTGLASVACFEFVTAGAAVSNGSYALLELELVASENYTTTAPNNRPTSYIWAELSGNDTAEGYLEDNTYLITINNHTAATGNMWYGNTLRMRMGADLWYIPMSTEEATYTTAYPIVTTSTLTVGASAAGTDVKFWGGLADSYVLWDASEDRLIVQNTFAADANVSTYEYGQYNGMIFNTDITTGKMVSGMKIAMEGTADYDSGSAVWPLWIDIQNTGTNNSDNFDMARFSVQSGACLPNSYISFQTASPGVDFLFEIVGNVSPYSGNAGTYSTADGYLLVNTPGGTRRIALYTAVD